MVHAVVLGAGLSGLATAILLRRNHEEIDRVTVLEKRAAHTREHFILLNHLGARRLKELGVYDVWKTMTSGNKATEYFDQVYLKGNIQDMVRAMKQQGMLDANGPDDAAQFGCLRSIASIHQACDAVLAGDLVDLDAISYKTVIALHDQGTGIEFAHIHELEKAMVQVASTLGGIDIVYQVHDIQLNASDDHVHGVRYQAHGEPTGMEINDVALVIDCEGSKRTIAKTQLQCPEERDDDAQWYVLLQVNQYYGPHLYLDINEVDPAFPETKLRHFACGGIQTKQMSFFYLQLPHALVQQEHQHLEEHPVQEEKASMSPALEGFVWRQLTTFTTLHGLNLPTEILWATNFFESRESYLKAPCYGDNVLVIGDAARTGSFQSGAGFNMILVNDLAAVDTLARHVTQPQPQKDISIATLAASVEEASAHFASINKARYY